MSFSIIFLISIWAPFCAPQAVEILNPTTVSQFLCMMKPSCFELVPFFIRVGKADGSIDMNGIKNLQNLGNATTLSTYPNAVLYRPYPFFIPNINLDANDQVFQQNFSKYRNSGEQNSPSFGCP